MNFDHFNQLICGRCDSDNVSDSDENSQAQLFDIEPLRRDTGFVAALGLKNIIA